jgi:hypothetical protein
MAQAKAQEFSDMTWEAALTLAVPAIVAVLGFTFAYVNSLRLARRNDCLERINKQLSDFYGPLLALSSASEASWEIFTRKYRSEWKSFWRHDPPPTPEETAPWRLWMSVVVMPLNRKMSDVIVSKADLIDETDVPSPLLDLCAHVAAYETVLKRWEAKDYSEHRSPLNFPGAALHEYVSSSFARLKLEQQRLLDMDQIPRIVGGGGARGRAV